MIATMTRRTKSRAAKPSAKAATASRLLSVYDGQERLGDIVERDGEFIASDVDGKTLGTFAAQRQAADAISAACRERRALLARQASYPPAARATHSTATPKASKRDQRDGRKTERAA
jgi:hypothetical protein